MRQRHRVAHILIACAFACGAGLIGWGILQLSADEGEAVALEDLAEETGIEEAAATTQGGGAADATATSVDWASLKEQNPDFAAWLTVTNTTIDVPLVQERAETKDYWLKHNFWGKYTTTGVPYIDSESGVDKSLVVAYGHRTVYRSYLFHDLSEMYKQDNFNGLGDATLANEDGSATFVPLCSADINRFNQDWQKKSASDTKDLREWLVWAKDNAQAKSARADELAAGATRALVLITCNGKTFYPETRTVTVFVQGA